MSDTREMAAHGPQGLGPQVYRLTGRHVLAMLVAFFGTVFVVNGYFLVRALSTHSGVVANEPYRKGLAYNERIRADDRQTALGWRDQVALARSGMLTVIMTGRDGKPASGLRISASLGRPSTAIADRTIELREDAPGIYGGRAAALEPGAWLVTFETWTPAQPDDPVYRAKRRLWLKP